ncbi:MAG TPA: hypothetical protein ENI95_06475 [Chloroflexi bacterium]|nr:hypothetical protein [Chloroflexota bacterium]
MRIPRALTALSSLFGLLIILLVGYMVSRPRGPVITEAEFGLSTITPNADGDSDVTRISYRIRRPAVISIYFEDENGERYYFRRERPRSRGEYSVLFSGVVEGFVQEGETVRGEVLARLLPDGEYTWVIEAVDQATGQTDRVTGYLTVADADPQIPDLWEFSISPEVFTPNQDGLDDRVWINVYVPKPATLQVFLINEEGERIFVPEFQEARTPGEEGRHSFEYDGGVDMGRSPPPDGTYTVLVEATDEEGQRVQRSGRLTIENGGLPLAEIVAQPVGDTVRFSSRTVVVGDVLTFELTVWNYGDAPIRTTGPAPGYIYDQDEVFSSTGYYEESGAWRVGIHCDTCLVDYPWRWALGTPENLTPIESNGQVHYYLMPGQRVVVTGGIRLHNIVESRNPQQFWAGLIHEDVGIAPLNNRVDPHWIEIVEAPEEDD